VLVLRTQGPALRSRPGRLLCWFTAVVGVVALAIPWLGPPAAVFGFVPLSLPIAGTIVCIVAAYMLSTELAKAWFFHRGSD